MSMTYTLLLCEAGGDVDRRRAIWRAVTSDRLGEVPPSPALHAAVQAERELLAALGRLAEVETAPTGEATSFLLVHLPMSQIEVWARRIWEIADRHGLDVYDPQTDEDDEPEVGADGVWDDPDHRSVALGNAASSLQRALRIVADEPLDRAQLQDHIEDALNWLGVPRRRR